jgi:hypothetical protein
MIVDRSRRCRLDGALQNPRFSLFFFFFFLTAQLSLSLFCSLSCFECVCVEWRRKGEEKMKGEKKRDMRVGEGKG